MRFVSTLLDKYKLANRLKNDSEVAESLGVTKASVSRWRNGVGLPEPWIAMELVKDTGDDAVMVLMRLEMDRARNVDNKQAWQRLLNQSRFTKIEPLHILSRKRA